MTYAYNPDGDWTNRHQMTLAGKRDGFTRDDLSTVGREMSIKKSTDIIAEVVEAVGRWAEFAAEVGQGWWSGEWRLQWRGMGVEPKEGSKLRLNIGVRKTAGPCPWVALVGTGAANFLVDRAGLLVLGE